MNKRKPVARKLLLALAMLANAISFNAIAQAVFNFKFTFDGSTLSLDVGSDPIQGTTLNVGDKFLLDIRAAGSNVFESKTDNESSTFPFASLHIENCATRTGNVTTTLLLDGSVVSQETTPGIAQSCVHVGAQVAPPLTVGLRFDQILVDYEFLASTSATNVLQGLPLNFATFTNPALFTFQQGSVSDVLATGLHYPQGVAIHNGVLYIADRNAHTVWKKNLATGEISPLAGTGVVDQNGVLVRGKQGYNGDGISATQALLNGPASVAVDANGNVFVADAGNHIVRMINTSGMITTVAGTPKTLSPIVNGLLAVGNGGPATAAFLNGPRGVAVAGNTLYIADTINQQVRKVEAGTISAVAGLVGTTGNAEGPVSTATLNDPRSIAVQVDGPNHVLYIADTGNNKIRKVVGTDVSSVAAGTLRRPAGVAVATDGTLYIADSSNHSIRRRLAADGSITTVAGTGTGGAATATQLNTPVGVALDTNGDLYIADQVNNRVVRVDFTP